MNDDDSFKFCRKRSYKFRYRVFKKVTNIANACDMSRKFSSTIVLFSISKGRQRNEMRIMKIDHGYS